MKGQMRAQSSFAEAGEALMVWRKLPSFSTHSIRTTWGAEGFPDPAMVSAPLTLQEWWFFSLFLTLRTSLRPSVPESPHWQLLQPLENFEQRLFKTSEPSRLQLSLLSPKAGKMKQQGLNLTATKSHLENISPSKMAHPPIFMHMFNIEQSRGTYLSNFWNQGHCVILWLVNWELGFINYT